MTVFVVFCAFLAQGVFRDHEPGIVAPRVIDRTAAEYTEEARLARLEGSVQVTLTVDQKGSPRDVHVSRPLGLGLDEKAVVAVREWHFAPARKDGDAISVMTRVEVNFRLLTAREDWHLSRADFETRLNVARPVAIASDFPTPVAPDAAARVVVSFDVGAEGTAQNVRVETSSDARFEAGVVAAMKDWKFRPAPATVHATFEFAAGPVAQIAANARE